jgi:CHAD domain-containing protein
MGLPTKSAAPIKPGMTVLEAFQTIMGHYFKYMEGWVPVVRKGNNIRGVHQFRVSFRQMRSAVGIFRGAIPRELTQSMALEMKWIASQFGPARDSDVFINEILGTMSGKIGPKAGEKSLAELTRKYNKKAYAQAASALDSKRFKQLANRFQGWHNGKFDGKISPAAQKSMKGNIMDYARAELDRRMDKVLARGAKINSMSDVQLHELRIECKKIRYATEFFTPLFGKGAMANFIANLKALQGTLGTLQDAAVMPALLDAITAGNKDADVKKYCANLIEWRTENQKKSFKQQLTKQWQAFSKTKRPWKK